jgi:hypothetical protein
MRSLLRRCLWTAAAFVFLASAAWSQCNNPSSPGVVICTPTNDSTVVYLNEISVRSTPASGASITQFIIYDNNVNIYQGGKGQTGIDLYDGAIFNGNHNVVVNAWDTDGNLYQAKSSFYVTGEGYAICPEPSSPGINFCSPPSGSVYGTDVTVGASAQGQSAIKNISVYLNGTFVTSVQNSSYLGTAVQLTQQGTPNSVTFKATDTTGHTYSATRTLSADYTYGQYSCFYTCVPGINIVAPQDEAYVGNSFNLNMQIVDNPKPITTMKAYIDSTVVATSSGANLQQEITDAPNGTHILTVQGWDTEGVEYRIQENININVSE